MVIGIFGGSFNPVHTGHAILANYISQFTDIDKVWLMVSPQNPLKGTIDSNLDAARIRMTEMVSRKCVNVITSGYEFTLPRPSYTIDTLTSLAQKFPNDQFRLIIGADNWATFDRWKESKKIIDEFGVIVYPRLGYEFKNNFNSKNVIYLKDAPVIEISSSFIREGIKKNANMSFYLPEDVYDYIKVHSLYK